MQESHEVIDAMKSQRRSTNNKQLFRTRSLKSYQYEYDQPRFVNDIFEEKMKQQQQWCNTINPRNIVLSKVFAHGAFGAVHKGLYKGQIVAVKVLDLRKISKKTKAEKETIKNDFITEAGLWKNLDHPNITKMIGTTTTISGHKNNQSIREGSLCIVAEYVKGGTLRSYLSKNRNKKLPLKIVAQFATDIAKGLSYLHSKKMIHRDVKPGNMLITKDRTIKLADFGMLVLESLDLMCVSTVQAGTHGYMAPEVAGGKPYGTKSDVYAFGICLWEIYCCDKAYTYDMANSFFSFATCMTKPTIPVDCPKCLAQLMERCLDTDPKKRPAMTDVVVELEEMVKSEEWKRSLEDEHAPAVLVALGYSRMEDSSTCFVECTA